MRWRIGQEQSAMLGADRNTGERQFLAQLVVEAVGGKIGRGHAVGSLQRLNIINLNVTGRPWKIRQTSC